MQPVASVSPYIVATDGACQGNPGPAGWAWVAEDGHWAAGSVPEGFDAATPTPGFRDVTTARARLPGSTATGGVAPVVTTSSADRALRGRILSPIVMSDSLSAAPHPASPGIAHHPRCAVPSTVLFPVNQISTGQITQEGRNRAR